MHLEDVQNNDFEALMWQQIIWVGRHFQSKLVTQYLRNIPDVVSFGGESV